MGEQELLDKIREEYSKLSREHTYYLLRARKIKYIQNETVDTILRCQAIHKAGLPITTTLFTTASGKQTKNTRTQLHMLGDKKILLLLRGDIGTKKLVWRFNDQLFGDQVKLGGDVEV